MRLQLKTQNSALRSCLKRVVWRGFVQGSVFWPVAAAFVAVTDQRWGARGAGYPSGVARTRCFSDRLSELITSRPRYDSTTPVPPIAAPTAYRPFPLYSYCPRPSRMIWCRRHLIAAAPNGNRASAGGETVGAIGTAAAQRAQAAEQRRTDASVTGTTAAARGSCSAARRSCGAARGSCGAAKGTTAAVRGGWTVEREEERSRDITTQQYKEYPHASTQN